VTDALPSSQIILVGNDGRKLGQSSLAGHGTDHCRPGVHRCRAGQEARQNHPVAALLKVKAKSQRIELRPWQLSGAAMETTAST